MAFNKLNNLIDKYNLTNVVKIIIIVVLLYLITRIFVPNSLIQSMIPSIIENFDSDSNTIYGNELALLDSKNIPIYVNNTCIFTLDNTYRIDTLKFVFNKEPLEKSIYIQFKDSNGNMKYIKSIGSDAGSPPNYKNNVLKISPYSLLLNKITDENDTLVYTSQIILTIGDDNTNKINGYISHYGIFGGESNLLTPDDYNKLSLSSSSYEFTKSSPNTTQPNNPNITTPNTIQSITTYDNANMSDIKIYSLKLVIKPSTTTTTTTNPASSSTKPASSSTNPDSSSTKPASSSTNPALSIIDMPFNIAITYKNSIYPKISFAIIKNYLVRIDTKSLEDQHSFIFLTESIIANSITLTINNINPSNTQPFYIEKISALGNFSTDADILTYKENSNSSLNISDELTINVCPSIIDLVDKKSTSQQLYDNLEYQDKIKSEKLRLEKNKQYLLKLQNQREQIDQLNNVIKTLDTKRQSRDQITDQVRVLQYKKQQGDTSTIRDLANQRLESQENNKLYVDVNVQNNT